MTTAGNEFAEKVASRFWRVYDFVERAGTGAVVGWFLTFPVMWMAGAMFGEEAGINGWTGESAWFATIPIGMVGWLWLRRGRPGGWAARAAFGGLVALPACMAWSTLAGMTGEEMLGLCIIGVPAGAIAWPVLIASLRRWSMPPPPPEKKEPAAPAAGPSAH